MYKYINTVLVFWILLIIGCNKETYQEWEGLVYPSHFPVPVQSTILEKKMTKEGFDLGKKLFYDPILSRDSTISCGSCHQQSGAFCHIGHDVSHGIEDKLGSRNAPALQNLIWQPTYFHDGGVFNIDFISLAPISNPVEMDEDINRIISKLSIHPEYPKLFHKVYNSSEITTAKILNAITQFQSMLISANSRYDKYLLGKENLTSDELEGKNLFEKKCAKCHSGILFSDFQYRNNGLDFDIEKDPGRYRITIVESDKGKFKTPSLRNIEKSYPYMHNGKLSTLENVLEHYNSGVKLSQALDSNLMGGIPMSKVEQTKIILFLKTLTDMEYLNDRRFIKPQPN